jgi:hypothetical protein
MSVPMYSILAFVVQIFVSKSSIDISLVARGGRDSDKVVSSLVDNRGARYAIAAGGYCGSFIVIGAPIHADGVDHISA